MKSAPRAFLAILPLIAPTQATTAEAQTQQGAPTFVVLHAPELRGAQIEMTIGRTRSVARVKPDGQAELVVPSGSSGTVDIEIISSAIGNRSLRWRGTINLGGSRQLEVQPDAAGATIIEWPALTLQAKTGSLDVSVNGRSEGTTATTLGVEPNKDHVIVWRRGNNTVCRHTVKLPAAVSRVFVCDSATGGVSEP